MKRRLPFDGTLIAVVLVLVGFGLAMLGLLALLGAMKVDYKIYAKRDVTLPLVLLTIGLLLLPILMSGSRWIHVGPLQFQPSELAKLTAILFTAYYLARRETDLTSFSHGVLPSVGIAVVLGSHCSGAGRPRSGYGRLYRTGRRIATSNGRASVPASPRSGDGGRLRFRIDDSGRTLPVGAHREFP